MHRVLSYSCEEFPFAPLVSALLDCAVLDRLHDTIPVGISYPPAPPGKDQNTIFHERFYARIADAAEFVTMYRRFIASIAVRVLGGGDYLYQRLPSLRVQVPGGQAAGGRWHRDADYHHPDGEMNLLLPLTRMFDTNTLFLESVPGRGDFEFIELEPGQVLVFDGRNCAHGNVPNETAVTRVSFDFRLLPIDCYNSNNEDRSVAYGLRFLEGEYYARSPIPAPPSVG